MNRRDFLKGLAAVPVAAVAPALVAGEPETTWVDLGDVASDLTVLTVRETVTGRVLAEHVVTAHDYFTTTEYTMRVGDTITIAKRRRRA